MINYYVMISRTDHCKIPTKFFKATFIIGDLLESLLFTILVSLVGSFKVTVIQNKLGGVASLISDQPPRKLHQ